IVSSRRGTNYIWKKIVLELNSTRAHRNRYLRVFGYWQVLLEHFRRRPAHGRAYFNRHGQRRTTATRRRRDSCSDRIGSLRAVDIYDPESREKLFTLGEHSIGDRQSILPSAHQPGLIGKREAFSEDELARFMQLLVEADHESYVRLQILLGPV